MISIPGNAERCTLPAKKLGWMLLIGLLVFAAPLWAVEVGRFQFVHGDVKVHRDGKSLKAARTMPVHQGDTLITASASSAQLRMMDGALLALRPNSELNIEAYQYQDNDEDASLVNLARGSLRSVTGALGRARPENVRIETPVATMGIRGTDMDTFVLPPAQGQELPDQAVLRVNSGRGTMSSGGVLLEVPTGSIAQAVRGQPPRFIPQLPASATKMEQQEDQDEATGEDEVSASQNEAGQDEGTANTNSPLANLLQTDSFKPNLQDLGIRELSASDERIAVTAGSPASTVIRVE